jgi:hypothetical protein
MGGVIDEDQTADRAALLGMKKLDMHALRSAYEGVSEPVSQS